MKLTGLGRGLQRMIADQTTKQEAKQRIRGRLARIEGQIRGLQRMIEEERPCDEILIQILAARAALERAAGEIVGVYLDECVERLSTEEARARIERTVKLLARVS